MKILEAQSATLTNYEVYTHLVQQEERYERLKKEPTRKDRGRREKGVKFGKRDPMDRRPGNLANIVKELLSYLKEAPSPLGSDPLPYNEHTIQNLLEGLRAWDFTKGEIIMILNLRPTKPENLNTIIEEMEERFPGDDLQAEILNAILGALGRPDGDAERQAMTDNALQARKEQADLETLEVDDEDEDAMRE